MKFNRPSIDFFVPDGAAQDEAAGRTTHLGIGAHQDDLEFMALDGILECYKEKQRWFGGVICTDGAGSARSGRYADFSDEQMRAIRVDEQRTAATLGDYSFCAQLAHPSRCVKDPLQRETLIADLIEVLQSVKPDLVYTHNPFDKHPTHIAVMLAVVEAIRHLAPECRPTKLFGCEVWRGLDWLPDELKIAHDVSQHPKLAAALSGVFESQISGGKRYDLAVEGRRLANASFHDSHSIDAAKRVQYAIDLTELISRDVPVEQFVGRVLVKFKDEIEGQIFTLSERDEDTPQAGM